MRLVAVALLSALLGCAGAALLPPELVSVRASSAAGDAVCVCRAREHMPPQWAAWGGGTHEAWHCTVIRPAGSTAAVACAEVNNQPQEPTGFAVVAP